MKLRITMENVEKLKNTLSTMLSIRKLCVLRFTPKYLQIVSASLNEPQVWCKLSTDIFDMYEIESARSNLISMEISIESLFNVLKTFEKANSEGIYIRLQKKLANEINVPDNSALPVSNGNERSVNNKRLASLAITYNELVSNSSITTTSINHSFKIPIRLLKKESDERILEPELKSLDLLLKLPVNVNMLFKRIERFKKSKNLSICGDRKGNLSLILNEDDLKVILSWDEQLLVQKLDVSISEDATNPQSIDYYNEIINVDVKLKDWKFGNRFCEICNNVVLILSYPLAAVLHCYLDDTDDVEIVYYMNGIVD